MNKLLFLFIILFILFGAFIFYQFGNKTSSKMKTTSQITINKNVFDVEIVKSDKDKQIGLTKYPSIATNQGMLFIFDQPGFYSFWMKNMKFPIDLIFIHNDTVDFIVENAAPSKDDNPPSYTPDSSSDKVLEINSGLIKKYNIKKGDKTNLK
ncbi:DUF192 domain-containing protein [Candidatus Roizmanbacteria bacterium]|nr:DUF192 domain-containing protein [Candidatus Roizmanbacteria bacterium]